MFKNSKTKKNHFEKIKQFYLEDLFSTKDIKNYEKITKNQIGNLRPKIGICASQIGSRFWIKNLKKYQGKWNQSFKKFIFYNLFK